MYLCALTAFLGAGVTYLLTPKYGSEELSLGEDNYLMLEHDCMRPSPEDLTLWETQRMKRAKSSQHLLQALEIIEGTVYLPNEDSITPKSSSKTRSLDNRGSGGGGSYAEAARLGAKTAASAAASTSTTDRTSDGRREGADVEADVVRFFAIYTLVVYHNITLSSPFVFFLYHPIHPSIPRTRKAAWWTVDRRTAIRSPSVDNIYMHTHSNLWCSGKINSLILLNLLLFFILK